MSFPDLLDPDETDGAPALQPRGALDMFAADRFAANVSDLMRAEPATLVVDLSEVEAIDASGIHQLLRARTAAAAQEIRLVLANPNDAVRRVLTVSGVARLFEIQPPPVARDGAVARPVR
jgi:anti-sigma B factor antagonist